MNKKKILSLFFAIQGLLFFFEAQPLTWPKISTETISSFISSSFRQNIAKASILIAGMGLLGITAYKYFNKNGNSTTSYPTVNKENEIAEEPIYPIVYHPSYNISLGFLDPIISPLHPFDTKKYGKIHTYLKDKLNLTDDQFHTPEKITDQELLEVHDEDYLKSLNYSSTISQAVDLWHALTLIPNWILQKTLLDPMRYAVGGTIKAAKLAMEKGWAINLSGGYHHAKRNHGEGGCIFADIPLAIKELRDQDTYKDLKVLIIDLDAHQGNGNADYFKNDPNIFIFDMYNENEYPIFAKRPTKSKNYKTDTTITDKNPRYFKYPLKGGYLGTKIGQQEYDLSVPYCVIDWPMNRNVDDEHYLHTLKTHLPDAVETFKKTTGPKLIIYNAGTDIFEKDSWGIMNVSRRGIIDRDLYVFEMARTKNIPIMMVLSGGYAAESAEIIGESIVNIIKTFNLHPQHDQHTQ